MRTRLRWLLDRVRAVLRERELAAADLEITVLVQAIESAAPGGLERCDLCGQFAAPRGGRLSLHYPKIASGRPCVRSWSAARSTT